MPTRIRAAANEGMAIAGGRRRRRSADTVGQPAPHRARHRDLAEAVARFERELLASRLACTVDDVRREFAGRDLACSCPEDEPCHADVLLRVANEPGPQHRLPCPGSTSTSPVADPRHTERVRRLVVDRLTPRQIDQLADISGTILDGLDAS